LLIKELTNFLSNCHIFLLDSSVKNVSELNVNKESFSVDSYILETGGNGILEFPFLWPWVS